MSGGDAHDWFGGRTPAEPRAPRPVGEAFGHLRRAAEDGAAAASEWFGAGASEPVAAAEPPAAAPESQATVVAEPPAAAPEPQAAAVAEPPAAAEPLPAAAAEPPASAAAEPPPAAAPPEPAPAPDPRVRLQALTGGLADLSDAMAAVGIESVAVRTPGPDRPAAAARPASAADFRVRCPDCGPQFVAVGDLRFVETGEGAEANRYLFTCPSCGARVRRPAGPELAEILKSSGVATLALRRGPGQAL